MTKGKTLIEKTTETQMKRKQQSSSAGPTASIPTTYPQISLDLTLETADRASFFQMLGPSLTNTMTLQL